MSVIIDICYTGRKSLLFFYFWLLRYTVIENSKRFCGCLTVQWGVLITQRGISAMSHLISMWSVRAFVGWKQLTQIALTGNLVKLYEMRGVKSTPQHKQTTLPKVSVPTLHVGILSPMLSGSKKKCVVWVHPWSSGRDRGTSRWHLLWTEASFV